MVIKCYYDLTRKQEIGNYSFRQFIIHQNADIRHVMIDPLIYCVRV